ncbi:hypothetical protein A8A01_22430 [Ewingella americana]|nr:hypothetical protein A8A01_22430 [Ewingella americana]
MKLVAGACYASLSAAEAAGWKVNQDVIATSTAFGRSTTSNINVFLYMPLLTNGVRDHCDFG